MMTFATEKEYEQEKEKGRKKKIEQRKKSGETENTKETLDEEKDRISIIFWNICGLKKKDKDFWDYIRKFEVVGLVETWVEEKNWENTRNKLPKEYRWKSEHAKRSKKRGRAKGGIITGIKEDVEEIEEERIKSVEGIQERRIKIGDNSWRIMTVYSQNVKKTSRDLDEINYEIDEKYCLVVGGDFNARIGNKGAEWEWDKEKDEGKSKSKDRTENKEGKKLLELVEEKGWKILNGNTEGDKEGEYTYIGGQGRSVIDYVICNEIADHGIRDMEVGIRSDSDHLPTITQVEKTKKEELENRREKEIYEWNEKSIEEYRRKLREYNTGGGTVEEMARKLKVEMGKASRKKVIKMGGIEKRGISWWDEECWQKKIEVRRKLRRWLKNRGNEKEYRKEIKDYKKLIKEKKAKKQDEEDQKLKDIRTEAEAWKYINQERKIKTGPSKNIKIEEWREYFIRILEGAETNEEQKTEVNRQETGTIEEREEIGKEEVIRVIGKMKKGKAAGIDGIQNEHWIYATENIVEGLTKMLDKIWKGEGLPEEWRVGLISPLHKKGNREKVENYRGITLLNTTYKIYSSILQHKLERDIEEKQLLPEVQMGFRKGRGTIECIATLDHIVRRELNEKGGKVYALFVDLKAAFDMVNRERLWQIMKDMGISKTLIERIREIYRETENRIRVNGETSMNFWTKKGVRQGCPLSPTLFSLYIAKLEENLRKAQMGGVTLGKTKIWSLQYADDIVLLAKTGKEIREMMKTLQTFLRRRELQMNVEKTKMMVFRKAVGRSKKEVWQWEEKTIEEVATFKYLGYTFQRNGRRTQHLENTVKKANRLLKAVWGLAERRLKNDFVRRIWLFDSLIKSVIMYGAEIWGWKERESLERVQAKYLKWTLGLEKETPEYIVLEETKREKLRIEAARRAMKFEEKIRQNVECKIMKEMWEEIRVNYKKTAEERREFYEVRGLTAEEVERKRIEGAEPRKEILNLDEELQRKEQRKKIAESRYNPKYGEIIGGLKLPEYLIRGRKNEDRKTIARFRVGNEEGENCYWKEEEDRRCGLCREFPETIEHWLKDCEELREVEKDRNELLNETGDGLEWMKMILEKKRK